LTTRIENELSASEGFPVAKATPTLEAAGIVVIETSTPTTAPDFARPKAMIQAVWRVRFPSASATPSLHGMAAEALQPVVGRVLVGLAQGGDVEGTVDEHVDSLPAPDGGLTLVDQLPGGLTQDVDTQ
jgi:hypothetical protein